MRLAYELLARIQKTGLHPTDEVGNIMFPLYSFFNVYSWTAIMLINLCDCPVGLLSSDDATMWRLQPTNVGCEIIIFDETYWHTAKRNNLRFL